MNKLINKYLLFVFILVICVFPASCGNSEEKKKDDQSSTIAAGSVAPVASAVKQAGTNDIAVSVDGNVLKKSTIEKDIKEKLNTFKDKIPADKVTEVRANMKKQMVEEFIMRTLMTNEVAKRKVAATENEIKITTDQIAANLPPDKKLDAFLKENKISKDDIILGIKVKKLVLQDMGKKAKPSPKEISKFYDENKDKFIMPENVHVRHILVTLAEGDDEKVKAEKKAKIEGLRKQLLDGANFAEVAKKNSDCPSKENGGDLGLIKKGQTVKPFEDAAFSQEKNVIGPVVTTEYGYHVIQVLEKNPSKTSSLEEVKSKIAAFLEQKKQSEAFSALLKKLRENAKIVIY
jgi:peptidyl-prolyl cis-trans isomerase C